MITYDYVPERGIQRGNPCSNIVVDSRFPYEMTAGIKIIEGTLREEFERYGGRVLQPVVPLHLEQITAHGEIGGESGVLVRANHFSFWIFVHNLSTGPGSYRSDRCILLTLSYVLQLQFKRNILLALMEHVLGSESAWEFRWRER
jgi:hypothetical protein